MEVTVPDCVNPLLCLLLHHADCGGAVAIWQCHGSQSLLRVLDRFVVNGGVASAWQWDGEAQFCLRRVQRVAPISVVPVERYYGVETLCWLEDSPCCNEEVTPAIDAILNGLVYLVDALVLRHVDV